jgi:gamma-glutamyl hercynylcysteine S-oxide synthase
MDIHDPEAMRRAGPEALGLALMDARNRTLQALSLFDRLERVEPSPEFDPPIWVAGQAARFQEQWLLRFVQRGRGESADPGSARLAALEPMLDWWLDPASCDRGQRWTGQAPAGETVRAYLLETMESTLELLDKAAATDEGLYFYRLALWHEDRMAEQLLVLAQASGAVITADDSLPRLPSRSLRDPIGFAAQRVQLGTERGGFVPDAEKWAHEVAVPAFDIDAQPVCWAQYAEFVDDGGYDDPAWWGDEGWAWVQNQGRRAPRYVEQFAGGVLVHRLGRVTRVPSSQAAVHLSWHEADAWCRWAGRRLPTEAEWTAAVAGRGGRPVAWGDVWEWMAGRARSYPGCTPGPAALDLLPADGAWRVQRGASFATPARQRRPAARRFVRADDDAGFCGFRSCAV